jgi:hypothetical protein
MKHEAIKSEYCRETHTNESLVKIAKQEKAQKKIKNTYEYMTDKYDTFKMSKLCLYFILPCQANLLASIDNHWILHHNWELVNANFFLLKVKKIT